MGSAKRHQASESSRAFHVASRSLLDSQLQQALIYQGPQPGGVSEKVSEACGEWTISGRLRQSAKGEGVDLPPARPLAGESSQVAAQSLQPGGDAGNGRYHGSQREPVPGSGTN